MKKIILFGLLTLSVATYGQTSKWQIAFQLQPEITFHKDSYRLGEKNSNETTFNLGVASSVQYNINNNFFSMGFVQAWHAVVNFVCSSLSASVSADE
ncbi:MAG: hypothetical protein WKF85_14505 [Chitinophagaceae bacterium]